MVHGTLYVYSMWYVFNNFPSFSTINKESFDQITSPSYIMFKHLIRSICKDVTECEIQIRITMFSIYIYIKNNISFNHLSCDI